MTKILREPPQERRLGYPMFALQLFTLVVVYLAAGIPPIAIGGETSIAIASSVALSAAGGMLIAFLWLRRDGTLGEAINLGRPAVGWGKTILYAIPLTIVIFAIFASSVLVSEALGVPAPDPGQVMDWVTQSEVTLIVWIILVACFAAGFGEEVLFRGFLMDRLSRLPGIGKSTLAVLLLQAFLFGLPHIYQGWAGVVTTGTIGLLFGWVRLRMGGNLWTCIFAHVAVDVIAMSLAYGDKLGWFATP